ncbi:hypothetical protein [Symbioplanes lichenis]|uniref:hypothetical protein n=1 Tax=Symbioplanes lichenis TaxID=1629072 RepID=UPI0027395F1C|nr:hypothetical protein [Actinoplanes lichenis]
MDTVDTSDLITIAAQCSSGNCPTIYRDGADVLVQGYAVEAVAGAGALPDGELVVRIPAELVREAARRLD